MPAADHTGFHRLAPPLQRWLWEQGWSGLREAQAATLPLLLEGESDVVIAAAPCPTPDQVLNRQAIGNPEKWDWVLPDHLFHASYASSRLDLAGAHGWCAGL